MSNGGIFGGLGYEPLGWSNIADGPADNAQGATPAFDSSVFDTGSGSAGGLAPVYSDPSGYSFPGFAPSGGGAGTFGAAGNYPGGYNAFSLNQSASPSYLSPSSQTQLTPMGGFAQPYDYEQEAENSATTPASSADDNSTAIAQNAATPSTDTTTPDTATTTEAASTASDDGTSSGAANAMNIQGSGSGMPIDVGAQPGLTELVQSTTQSIQQAVGSMAQTMLSAAQSAIGTAFAGVTNWFVRGAIIVLGIVIAIVALARILFPDQSKELAHAMVAAAMA
jgi:hypothetical protein